MAASADQRPRAGDDTLKSMVKMLSVLDCFTTQDRKLTPSEIARRTRLPRATAHRIVASLKQIGLLDQDRERDAYRLGLKLFELGSRVLANMDLHREARPFVSRLQQTTGEVVHLCVFNGSRMVLIDRRELEVAPLNIVTTMEEAPAHCTGVGKAFLAFQDTATIERIIGEGLTRFTSATITEPRRLRAELAAICARGWALDDEEHQPDQRCVAAPIRDVAGRVVAAISVSGPSRRIPDRRIETLAELVTGHADAIAAQLGYRPQD
jgi:DNA-binding IclR family transcriptional regulator